jgi:ribosomal protein S12 methylthiotransferase
MVRRARLHPELAPALASADALVSFEDYPRLPEIVRGLFAEASGVKRRGLQPSSGANAPSCPAVPAGEASPRPGDFDSAPRMRIGSPGSAFLKISEGCDNRCSYCAIGMIRGPHASRPIEHLVAEARDLAAIGCREICLVAQDTTRYGTDIYGSPRLPELLRAVAAVEGIRWVRLLYAHPARLDEEILRTLASGEKFCPYVDVPLQHVDDGVLKAMGRGMSRKDVDALLDRIRRILPSAAIRTSLLTGHPGETEAAFERLLEFVREGHFAHMGAFAYSPEPGTPSAAMEPACDSAEAVRRRDELMRAQREVSARWCASFVGKEENVLIDVRAGLPSDGLEMPRGARWRGRISRQAPDSDGVVWILGDSKTSPGEFVRARVEGAGDYDLIARVKGAPR